MSVSPDNQPKISLEENVPKGFEYVPDNQPQISLEENVPKSFEYVQPPESKKSFNSYNSILLAYTVKLQIFRQIYWTSRARPKITPRFKICHSPKKLSIL